MLATTEDIIQKRPDRFGGAAFLTRSRLPVYSFVQWKRFGVTDEDLNGTFPDPVIVEDSAAAWDYYEEHREEIDDEIRAQDDGGPRIRKTPGVQGGDACIRSTRIPVWGLVAYRQLGVTDSGLLMYYPGSITPEDLLNAWDYYARFPEEIDEAIRDNESLE